MKRTISILALAMTIALGGAFIVSCTNDGGQSSGASSGSEQKQQLATPKNVKVSDDYILTFDAVNNATSYEITTDFMTFTSIGNVTTYNLSSVYGSSVGVKAVTSDESYEESSVAVVTLDNYSNKLTGFEEGLGAENWSGSLVGYAELFGPSADKSHSGNNAFKVFCGNSQNYFGGALFDTGFYNMAGQIDFANVKEISWWSYIDTKNLTEIEALCETYGSKYNAEIANIEEVYGNDAGGLLQIFYANDKKEDIVTFDQYTPNKIKTNQWYKTTVDVSLYKEVTDITLMYGNSVRSFTGDNGPGQWSVPSDYSYLLYWDDIEVVYDTVQLDAPTDIAYEGGEFSWMDVEGASAYEVTFDNETWQKVTDTCISAEGQEVEYFGIKAVNGRKYADGTARYAESPVVYFSLNNAVALGDIKNVQFTCVGGASFRNAITWDAVENASGYAISFDNNNWKLIGEEPCYQFDQDYNQSEIYIKALPAKMNYKESAVASFHIDNISNFADFEGLRSNYIGNDNMTYLACEPNAHYGTSAFAMERTPADNEGNFSARVHFQSELVALVDWDKVNYITYWIKVEDIVYKGESQNTLYKGGSAAMIELYTANGNRLDAPVDITMTAGEWYQIVLNTSTFVGNLSGDYVQQVRLYSLLCDYMFDPNSSSNEVPENSSFKVYMDDVCFHYDNDFVIEDENMECLDFSTATNTVNVGTVNGAIKNVYVDGMPAQFTYADGVLTLDDEFVSYLATSKEHVLQIVTDAQEYAYTFTMWDMVINSVEDFQQMLTELSSGENNKRYALATDIDASALGEISSSATFNGVLDGRGHTISNLTTMSGIVKVLQGTIKNIAFVNGVGTRAFLVYQCSGTLENVYVEASVTTNWAWFGVCSTYREGATVTNCVFISDVQDYDDGGGAVGTVYTNTAVTMTNVYVVNKNTCPIVDDHNKNVIDVSAGSGVVDQFTFTDLYSFYTEKTMLEALDFDAENGWAAYWTKDENGNLKFGNNVLVEYVEFVSTKLNISTSRCEVGEIVGSIETATLGETELTVEYENGILKISSDLSAFTVGEKYYLTLVTDKDTFKYEVEVIELPTIYSKLDVAAKTIACENIEGQITDITINGFETTGAYADGVLTIAELPDTLVAGNSYMVYVNTTSASYIYNVEVWTSIISNATEFKAMIETINASNSSAYFLFDADVDANEVTWTAVNGRVFSGVIDGAGHTVSNMKSVGTGYMGIVKELTGTIKNIAFVNGVGERCFLLYQMSGTLENVYVEATVTTNWTWFGVCATYRNDGVAVNVKNCVFNTNVQDYDGGGGAVGAVYTNGQVNMSNVYVFNRSTCPVFDDNSTNVIDISENSGTSGSFTYSNIYEYTKTNNFLKGLSFNAQDGWATYWSIDENKNLLFGGKTLVSYIEYTNTILNKTEKTCNVGEIEGEITSVTLNGTEIECAYADGVLTIDSDLSAYEKDATYEMIVETAEDTYKYRVTIDELLIEAAAYDLTNKNVVIGSISGTLQSITLNGQEAEGTYADGVLTITSAVAGLTANNVYRLIVATDVEKYGFDITAWTMIVSNTSELQAMVNMIQGTANDAGYYTFDASVDATGVTSTSAPNHFYGMIDGNGYTVSNFAATAKGLTDSFFGTIKNIAFTGATTSGSLLAYEMKGTASNIYVELTITSESPAWYGVFGKIRSSATNIQNSVFNVSVPVCGGKYTSYGGVLGACVEDGTLSNVCLIKNNCGEATPFYGSCSSSAPEVDLSVHTNVIGYTSCAEFVNSVEFKAENGWAEYWSVDANGNVLFGNVIVIQK